MSFPDICPACGRLADKPHYDGCDADKAALFDVLAARIEAGAWLLHHWNPEFDTIPAIVGVGLTITATGRRVRAWTLAEAVEKAMEAEGGVK